ncbi:HAD family hydrolase [Nocardia pseudobrasiliensis]|uniref:Phosphoglycolate phosphatase n=1 Tax=Nocardia pseudobrasiliensis TaxID=45979 RepID=A0A370IA45_9NOCA|nr:HAD family hydrolase [Nocardia pseudobrasiliensis]RDI67582.1 phosphoglycolate phosphatase [Nocardia pseudobrasiliensis]
MPFDLTRSALLFDLDGTLLDTPRAIAEQFALAVEAVTGDNPGQERARALVGAPLERMAAQLSGTAPDSDIAQAISADYLTRYREIIVPKATDLLFPGVREGLERLARSGLRLAVVTSKKHRSAELILDAAGIAEHFEIVVGADDVAHPKPHRDSADAALAALGLSEAGPGGAVIGDTAADIGLGKAIGTYTVGVAYGVSTADQITATAPDLVALRFDDVTSALVHRIGK